MDAKERKLMVQTAFVTAVMTALILWVGAIRPQHSKLVLMRDKFDVLAGRVETYEQEHPLPVHVVEEE